MIVQLIDLSICESSWSINKLSSFNLKPPSYNPTYPFSQVGFAPVKMFPRLLLDDEASQHEDGVREVVKMMKKAGETLGLRRKVEKSDGNVANWPNPP